MFQLESDVDHTPLSLSLVVYSSGSGKGGGPPPLPAAYRGVGGDLAAQANFRASLPEFLQALTTTYNNSMLELLLEAVAAVVVVV